MITELPVEALGSVRHLFEMTVLRGCVSAARSRAGRHGRQPGPGFT